MELAQRAAEWHLLGRGCCSTAGVRLYFLEGLRPTLIGEENPMLEHEDKERLLTKIEDERHHIEAFLRRARPRYTWLMAITMVSSALAAALNAGPGLGGEHFTNWARDVFNREAASDVWRPLCLAAMVVSIIATICVNLSQASKTDSKIVSAEVCNTELACLSTLVEFHQVRLDEALKLFQQHLARVPFIDHSKEVPPVPDWA